METIRRKLLINCKNGLIRLLMSSEEIKEANKMVKEGILYKGVSDDKQKTVVYFTV